MNNHLDEPVFAVRVSDSVRSGKLGSCRYGDGELRPYVARLEASLEPFLEVVATLAKRFSLRSGFVRITGEVKKRVSRFGLTASVTDTSIGLTKTAILQYSSPKKRGHPFRIPLAF